MGVLVDGYEGARRIHDANVAEQQRKEVDVADHLKAVASLIEGDSAFLAQNRLSQDRKPHSLNISRGNIPLITVHFDSASATYTVTLMRDGARRAATTPAECVETVGAMLYAELAGP